MQPERKRTTLKTILQDLRLVMAAIGPGNIRKVSSREALIKAKYPMGKMNYLWFIGVMPGTQRQGIGRQLLREVVAHSGHPVYLETSMSENVQWYEKNSFEVYHTLHFDYADLYILRTV